MIENKYIVGKVIDWNEDYFNTEYWWRVIPETVGQFTGLYDKNGKEIYEGDILGGKGALIARVQFKNGTFVKHHWNQTLHIGSTELYNIVIGNIHDNKELLE